MAARLRLDEEIVKRLCCPACKSKLRFAGTTGFECANASCRAVFPIIDGIPVLIDDSSSVFSVQDFIDKKETFFKHGSTLRERAARLLPSISRNIKAPKNYRLFAARLKAEKASPTVLVIGGSVVGEGLESVLFDPLIRCVESDVSIGPRTVLICDAHDLPFVDGTFDGVIAQAVLEHVLDPRRCVDEIHRVLAQAGLVYAEIPFMQQVHGGRFDFTRLTHLGTRRLFGAFEEIESGAVCGPGMALAWSYTYFLRSFASSNLVRPFLTAFGRLTSFWLKYLDHLLIDNPGALDAASGFYFLGRKSDQVISVKDVIRLYRGAGGE